MWERDLDPMKQSEVICASVEGRMGSDWECWVWAVSWIEVRSGRISV